MERYKRFSTAIDRALSPKVRASFTFALGRFNNQVRGVNLNAPVNGVRPDPRYANLIEVASDATHAHAGLRPRPQHQSSPAAIARRRKSGGIRMRTTLRFNYRYRRTFNNSEGAFTPSPSGIARHRVGAVLRRHASPVARIGVEPGAAESQRAVDSRQQ